VKLKPLQPHLRYEFLDPNQTSPFIVGTKLNDTQLKKLLGVLQEHKDTIDYNVDGV